MEDRATSFTIEITRAQAGTLATLADTEGPLAIRQLTPAEGATHTGDIYATPHGASRGYRIALDGGLSPIGQTLPGPE